MMGATMTETDSAGPQVGIFWLVNDGPHRVFVMDGTPITMAETYGDCLTHSRGHYELWERWSIAGAAWLRQNGYPTVIASTEYDDHPRGRIVYEVPRKLFVLYADRRIQRSLQIRELEEAFGLQRQQVVVRSDSHYR
jgi:hypothetical protein